MKLYAPDVLQYLAYEPNFLSDDEHARLLSLLEAIPTVRSDDEGRKMFAYVHPRDDGVEIASRKEAAAGNPISLDGQPVAGVPMPEPLAQLAARVGDHLRGQTGLEIPVHGCEFTSVYVDWYEAGGHFVPHVDRDIYGPIIAGVSAGTGSVALEFVRNDVPDRVVGRLIVEPRSLYAFYGPIRYEPWLHQVRDVDGRRFGITFRSPRHDTDSTT